MSFYKSFVRPLLFATDPERAHHLTVQGLQVLGSLAGCVPKCTPWFRRLSGATYPRALKAFGLNFANPVGLAPGFDKNAQCLAALPLLGFGFSEIGTVTYHPQDGNPRPRLFRYPQQEAVINRMGFNNEGAVAIARRLARYRPVPGCPLGVNIGKSRIIEASDLAAVIADYVASFRTLAPYADYVTLNVSSPNTPGLRQLQEASALRPLLAALQEANQDLMTQHRKLPVPLLLKVDPDLGYPALDALLAIVHETGVAGLVATNTSVQRPGTFAAAPDSQQTGGLSGAPLFPLALQRVRYVAQVTQGRLPIIASGGICNADQASQMLDAGASLIQIYTGLIFQGPGLVHTLVHGLKQRYGPWV